MGVVPGGTSLEATLMFPYSWFSRDLFLLLGAEIKALWSPARWYTRITFGSSEDQKVKKCHIKAAKHTQWWKKLVFPHRGQWRFCPPKTENWFTVKPPWHVNKYSWFCWWLNKDSGHITLHKPKGLIYFIQMDWQCWHKVRINVKSGIWLIESRECKVYQCKVLHVICFMSYPLKSFFICSTDFSFHDLLFFPLACVMATCQSKKQKQSVNRKNLFTLISIILSIQSHVKLIILKCQVLCEMHNLKVTKE